MIEIRQTEVFARWHRAIRDGVCPGYRIYFVQRGELIVILLCGGDKSTQRRDIETALRLARELEGE